MGDKCNSNEKVISFDDEDDGLLTIDLTPSGLSACITVKSEVTGFGIFVVNKRKNPLIFSAIEDLYEAVIAEKNI